MQILKIKHTVYSIMPHFPSEGTNVRYDVYRDDKYGDCEWSSSGFKTENFFSDVLCRQESLFLELSHSILPSCNSPLPASFSLPSFQIPLFFLRPCIFVCFICPDISQLLPSCSSINCYRALKFILPHKLNTSAIHICH